MIIALLISVTAVCATNTRYLSENQHQITLKNDRITVTISKNTGNITSIILDDTSILSGDCVVHLKREPHHIRNALSVRTEDRYPTFAAVHFTDHTDNEIIEYDYTIDTCALRWKVHITADNRDTMREVQVDFLLPISKNVSEIFHCGLDKPLPLTETTELVLTYRHDLYIPMITGFSPMKNYGVSIVCPLELPKPGLYFSIDREKFVISYQHLLLAPRKNVEVAVYIVPHEGDWRPGLNFVLHEFPDYFNQAVERAKISEGWYYLSYPFVHEKKISELHQRNVQWIELHEYFPFYGLYMPHSLEWGIIIDSDNVSISNWEKGAGIKRTSYSNIKNLIDLFHKYGISVYLYFQNSEAWHQYAAKYFPMDIARRRNGSPLPAWKFTNLMNFDPDNEWGKHIINQAQQIIEKFPEIDGIFYDRLDYEDYDFAHVDGLTIVDGERASMLGFVQEKINEKIFDMIHSLDKGIWGNGPTSIEVCKKLDGIMAERSLNSLIKTRYLGLVRPIVYLPYDKSPSETEEKLKYALINGAFPSISYGGKECQHLEKKFRPLFELIRNRQWVLTPHPLQLPQGLQGNIYQTPDGDYVVVINNPEKSQLLFHPFDYNIPVAVTVPNSENIEHAYLLSGDWLGVNSVNLRKKDNRLEITIPLHLSATLILLSAQKRFDLVRVSSPALMRGHRAVLIFQTNDTIPTEITVETPWFQETACMSNRVAFETVIPESVGREVEIKVTYHGKHYTFTSWTLDPISIAPVEDIFIHDREGEFVQFYVTNNVETKTSFRLNSTFINGRGRIDTPREIELEPLESKKINLLIQSDTNGVLRISAASGKTRINREFTVGMFSLPDVDDLFHDEFEHDMNRWTRDRGEWIASNGIAQGSGSAHLAYHIDNNWRNYTYEVTLRCRGSDNSQIDWLKSYIFFRLQDEQNFYRFGMHGDAAVVDLYKCENGAWTKLGAAPFIQRKDKWYTLNIQAIESKIVCRINGMQVIEVNDSTFASGGIGLGVLEDSMRCEYKNVIVRGIN